MMWKINDLFYGKKRYLDPDPQQYVRFDRISANISIYQLTTIANTS